MQISKQLKFSPKRLFLMDALGALVAAFFLGVVLVRFNDAIGIPVKTLYILAVLPCFFAVYSFSCYFFVKSNWRIFLRIIAIANLIYCFITIGLMTLHYEDLTTLGLLYFFVELIVLAFIINIELRA